jgi:hypothetical protein
MENEEQNQGHAHHFLSHEGGQSSPHTTVTFYGDENV